MAKRYTDTDKWKDDWYVSLSNDYKIVWQWLLDNCNHAGICKRSISTLNRDCSVKITEDQLLNIMEGRVLISDTRWFIPKFLKFQYSTLLSAKPAIKSVRELLLSSNLYLMIPESFGNDYKITKESLPNSSTTIKDKDKDKDSISLDNIEDAGAQENHGPFKFPGKPKPEDVPDLPESTLDAVYERQYQLGNSGCGKFQIKAYWKSWLATEYAGDTFSPSAADIFKHFARACNMKPIKFHDNGRNASGGVKLVI